MGYCNEYVKHAFDDVDDDSEFKQAVVTTLEYFAEKIDDLAKRPYILMDKHTK